MNGKMEDSLEKAIQDVLDEYCEDPTRWPEGYCPPRLSRMMAMACAVVFDASFESSVYTEKETCPHT